MKKLLLAATVVAVGRYGAGGAGPGSSVQPDLWRVSRRPAADGAEKGDHAAWEPRLAKGMPTLVQHVTNGFNAMPPRGCAPTAVPKTTRQPSSGW